MKLYILIGLSFLGGIVLMLLPIPNLWGRPYWLVVPLIYWTLKTPQHVNIGMAACVGLILDIICNSYIGKHMLILVLGVLLLTKLREQFEKYH